MEKKSRKKRKRQQNQRNHLPLLQSFTISEVMWKQDSYSALNLQEFHPNFRGWTSALSSTCVFWLLFHSRINLPVTFSIKLWNCAEAINPDHQFYGWGKCPPVPLCWDTITGHHRDQGESAWKLSLGEWRCPFLMEKLEQGSQEKRWDQRRSAQNKRKEGNMQIYF